MKKTAILLILISIISKVIGFGREIILAYFYGASNISDAYIISMTIPTVVFAFIGSAISTAFIPMYTKIEKHSGEGEANNYTNNLVNLLMIVSTIIVFLGLIFTKQIVFIFASGFEGETLALAIRFTRVSLLGIYFTSLVYVFNSFLQIKGNYVTPALIGFPMNIIIVLSIILSYYTSVILLAVGVVLSVLAQFVFLIPSIYKKSFRYKKIIDIKNPQIKNMMYLALPVILGVAVNDINVIVDRTIASQLATGGISALNYAQRLNGFVQGIIVVSISTAMYPLISKMAVENKYKDLKKTLSEAIVGTSMLIMPCTLGAMIFSTPIIETLFGRGAFDTQAIEMTSNALFFYALGMTGIGLRQILSRPFYSMQDTKTPVINASIGMVINIFLNIILSRYLGIGGLALATSISATITALLLFISLRRKIGPFGMKQISISFLKVLFSSMVMGLASKISFNYLTNISTQNASLLMAIFIGAISYFVVIYFMKIEEVDVLVASLKKKLGRGVA
ncbi:murein biosynthesis integral membrane protein MurJ [Alkalicella caledoniensis]|uniref:Probable lipid II flippase MurJ n=1 Tax=Alkalicella caledoniensis TaxID=2731377 RepID=A0A7G9W3W6_ALKCA|nr:murein biosynthesis integral membrane protein MurJ [Alkalicella caledoniensis]QNO13378.1 murein biosynthesis integral membrane protein MurJ [Alkalicella caledoniensis]